MTTVNMILIIIIIMLSKYDEQSFWALRNQKNNKKLQSEKI